MSDTLKLSSSFVGQRPFTPLQESYNHAVAASVPIHKFIRDNFKQRTCNLYVEKRESPDLCCCGRYKVWHDRRNVPPGKPGAVWSVDTCTETRPSNTFGKIRMQGFSKLHQTKKPKLFGSNLPGDGGFVQYIRVDGRTSDMDKLWTLMIGYWKMPEPDLILSINGGTKRMKKLSSDLSAGIRHGLFNVSSCLNTWIITGGVNVGVSQLIGQAAHELPLQAQTDEKELTVVGIASWGTVHNRHLLANMKIRQDGNLETRNYINSREDPGKGQIVLEPNHTHFLLVDDGCARSKAYNSEVGFRFDLELSMAKQMAKKDSSAPVVQLLIEGGKRALMMVQSALGVKIPVVVVKGSGRCADLIAVCIERTQSKEKSLEYVENVVFEELSRYSKDMEIGEGQEFQECIECIKSICMESRQKVSIFDIFSSKELDKVIIMAILNNDEHTLKMDQQLRLTMRMNRWDLAKEVLANPGKVKRTETLNLDNLMLSALINNQPHFVDLFLDEGVVIQHFLKKETLYQLYEESVFQRDGANLSTSEAFLRRILDTTNVYWWHTCWSQGRLNQMTKDMTQVSLLISQLTDQFVTKFYDPDDFTDTNVTQENELDPDFEDEDEDPSNKRWTAILSSVRDAEAVSFSPAKKKTNLRHIVMPEDQELETFDTLPRSKYSQSPNHEDDEKVIMYPKFPPTNLQGDRVFTEQDLFLWAILLKRMPLAKIFWRLGKDHISSALVAKSMFTRLADFAENEGELGLANEFKDHAKEFESLAVGSLSVAYSCGKSRTHILLCRSIPSWGNNTCMTLASQFTSMEFLHHTACQTRLNKIWMGAMPSSTHNWKIFLNIFLSIFFIRTIFPWVPEVKTETKQDLNNKNPPAGKLETTFRFRRVRHNRRRYEKLMSGIIKLEPNYKRLSYFQALKNFYCAPITKFFVNLILYIHFLVVLTYFVLVQLRPVTSFYEIEYLEYIVWIWCSTIIFQELRQVGGTRPTLVEMIKKIVGEEQSNLTGKLRDWFRSAWNKFDLGVTIFFLLSVLLRYTLPQKHFDWSRMVYALMCTMFYLRFLQFYFAHRSIGPKVVMVHKMVNDVVFFLCIYGVFVLAYGTLNQALMFPNREPSWKILVDIVYYPYWQTYGELNLEMVEGNFTCKDNNNPDCGRHSPLVVFAFAVFMLATNVLLLNLLIAMFGNTFAVVQSTSERVWAYNRYSLVQEFVNRPTAPPPFSILSIVYDGLEIVHRYLRPHNTGLKKDSPFVFHLHQENYNKITQFEHHCMEHYCLRDEGVRDEDKTHRTMEKMEELMKELNALRQSSLARASEFPDMYMSTDDDIGANSYNPLAPQVFLNNDQNVQTNRQDSGDLRLQSVEIKLERLMTLVEKKLS